MTGIDTEFIFNIKKAENGDVDSICKVIDRYKEMDDWNKVIEYFEMLVENEPKICEERFLKINDVELTYQFMLEMIAKQHYADDNFELACKWGQKELDYYRYMNIKYADQTDISSLHIYKYLESVGELDKAHNEFLLRWEIDRLDNDNTQANS